MTCRPYSSYWGYLLIGFSGALCPDFLALFCPPSNKGKVESDFYKCKNTNQNSINKGVINV